MARVVVLTEDGPLRPRRPAPVIKKLTNLLPCYAQKNNSGTVLIFQIKSSESHLIFYLGKSQNSLSMCRIFSVTVCGDNVKCGGRPRVWWWPQLYYYAQTIKVMEGMATCVTQIFGTVEGGHCQTLHGGPQYNHKKLKPNHDDQTLGYWEREISHAMRRPKLT